ncbi:MAG TPA: hypothetical protein VMW01_15920 [Williamwhitmania sp.]|nr:hypothetical protein [Williamwhitmania sp.]
MEAHQAQAWVRRLNKKVTNQIRVTAVALLLSAITQCAFAQKPDPPVFKYITNNLTTGRITLGWNRSPSPDSLIFGYIIYHLETDQLGNMAYIAIDSVASNVFTYTDINVDGSLKSETYKMATKGKTEPSKLTDLHTTMWGITQYDSCKATLNIRWTRYIGWGNRIKHYYVYSSNGAQNFNPSSLVKIATVAGTDTSYALTNATENEWYHFAILAVKDDVDSISSWSNHFSKFTHMPLPPATLAFDSLVSLDTKVRLHYNIDSQTEVTNFEIFRSDNLANLFSNIHTFSDKFEVEFTDQNLARGRTYYYYLTATNACGNVVAKSDTARSESLTIRNAGEQNILFWLPYPSQGGTYSYSVWRKTSVDPDFIELANNLSIETYTDDLTSLKGQNMAPEVCYKIEAHWQKNNIQTISQSQVKCAVITPDIIMPDAIDPLSEMINPTTNKRRNRFEPIIGFTADFTLQVFDRNGKLLYDGTTGWDGRINHGEFARPGSYIYLLKVTLPNGDVVEKNGTVNVVYRKQ